MKNYVKPVVLDNEEIFEGVYAASGVGSDCYEAKARIVQTPQLGQDSYVVQADATHTATDGHHSGQQILTLYFNKPVTFNKCSSSNARVSGGDGTSELRITYNYHNNANEDIGLGDIYVKSEDGLEVYGAKLECDYGVSDPNTDHTW